jgi:hypothetical protein
MDERNIVKHVVVFWCRVRCTKSSRSIAHCHRQSFNDHLCEVIVRRVHARSVICRRERIPVYRIIYMSSRTDRAEMHSWTRHHLKLVDIRRVVNIWWVGLMSWTERGPSIDGYFFGLSIRVCIREYSPAVKTLSIDGADMRRMEETIRVFLRWSRMITRYLLVHHPGSTQFNQRTTYN